jgi:hypothetical protein
VHINRKRQFDSKSGLDAQSSAQEANPTRHAEGRFSLQRCALACFGILGMGSLLAIAGCPANLEDPERFNVAGTTGGASAGGSAAAAGAGTGVNLTNVTALFSSTCATSVACHVAGANVTGLDLMSPNLEQRLVNVPAMHQLAGVTDCPMVKLVDTTNPMKSWILSKVTPGAFGDCGALMPFGGAQLSAMDLGTITTFVQEEAAAANGGTVPSGAAGAAAGGAPAAAGGAPAGAGASAAGSGGAPAGGMTAGSGGM